jgi:succinate dehydrogenase / fumarate reductase, cytochrome b subunit
MADVNRGNRPLSPHLTVYKPTLNMVMSIAHRITGAGLAVTALLVVWWFLAAAAGPSAFATADGLLTSWLGILVLVVSLAALWYHFWNGIRHLWWDAGRGFELDAVQRSGVIALAAAGVSTVLTLFLAAL